MKRRISRKIILGSLGAQVAAPLMARAAEAYTLRLNLAAGADSILGLAGLRFASAVERRSAGQLKIEVYPSLQLAKEQESIDALVSGVLDLTIQSSPFLVPLSPQYQVFDMPFLFKTFEGAYRVLSGSIGDELFAELEPKGIVGLGWGSGGFKQLETTTKPVVVPEDMKGLRLRIPSGAIYVATYRALGAIPVFIDFSETYVSLSQRVIDGLDINLDLVTTAKLYNVIKHIAMSNHIISVMPLLASKRRMDQLPPSLQKILKEEGRAVMPYWKNTLTQRITEDVRILKSNGVAFSEIQFQQFRKAMDPVYATFQSRIGIDLIERISKVAAR